MVIDVDKAKTNGGRRSKVSNYLGLLIQSVTFSPVCPSSVYKVWLNPRLSSQSDLQRWAGLHLSSPFRWVHTSKVPLKKYSIRSKSQKGIERNETICLELESHYGCGKWQIGLSVRSAIKGCPPGDLKHVGQ